MCKSVLRSDYENINIMDFDGQLSVCDLQKSPMRGIMLIMVLVQYQFFMSQERRLVFRTHPVYEQKRE